MKYRRDIDGLRSLAIVPVVLFHAGATGFSGGYIGVDVFFVISGFLITSVIRNDLELGRFSIARFYERRCRRILPALVATILSCLVAGYFIMLPGQYADLGGSALAALLFVSNIFFWQETGYFAPVAEWMPLLNMWSLAVEEQYYILFPLFMVIARRWRVSLIVGTVALVCALSFGLSAYAAYRHPSAAFYLTPFRAWELLLGVLVAYAPQPNLPSRGVRELLAVMGLLMIVGPVVLYDLRTPFPGVAAFAPCAGTMLLLAVGPAGPNAVRSLLETRVFVLVGLISYSLYLWHWPLFSFIRLRFALTELTAGFALFGTALSLVLAVASWRFIERPFRLDDRFNRAQIFRYSAVAIAGMVVAAGVVRTAEGMPWRVSPEARALEESKTDIDPLRDRCRGLVGSPDCEFGDGDDAHVSFALWGDSHGAAFRPALETATRGSGKRGILLWLGGCPPLIGVRTVGSSGSRECNDFRMRVMGLLLDPSSSIETVVLSARWSAYATGRLAEVGGSYVQLIEDDETIRHSQEENARVFLRGLHRSIEALRAGGKRIVFVGSVPDVGWDVPTVLALSKQHDVDLPKPIFRDQVAGRERLADEMLAKLSQQPDIAFVPVWDLLCPDECIITSDGRALYSDDDHLSAFGAGTFVGPPVRDRFRMAQAAP